MISRKCSTIFLPRGNAGEEESQTCATALQKHSILTLRLIEKQNQAASPNLSPRLTPLAPVVSKRDSDHLPRSEERNPYAQSLDCSCNTGSLLSIDMGG